MRPTARFSIPLALGLLLAPVGLVAGQQPTAASTRASFGKLPLYFVENRGVYADEVRYYIQGADQTLYFTDHGVTIRLKGKERSWTVKLDFVGADPDARPEGRDKQQAVFSYFKGPEKDWKAGLRTFSKVVYRDLWPGIDLVYNGTVNKLKYEFVVAPGADPKRIRLRYRGVEKLERTDAGALKVTTPEGSFEDAPPVAWQEIGGKPVRVEMAYAVGEDGVFTFEVGDYDDSKRLVLDPAVIVYCGYIGGGANDQGTGIAVDAAGNAYVTGHAESPEQTFPVTVGPDLTHNAFMDAFVAKLNPQGTGLVYCGYIGGAATDGGYGIAVDAAGNAYVTGDTSSTEQTFPVTVGPDLTHNGGSQDAFVAKVSPQGMRLVYCGYIGGAAHDDGEGIAVDAAGNAYVTGDTSSTEQTFPVTVGPDPTFNGNFDAFVAKVSPQGTGLVYCGYIGGTATDTGHGIAVDASGNAYVIGDTFSTEQTFPVTVGPDLTYNGGRYSDAYVAKVSPQGTGLVYCGYIGGASTETGYGIAVDATGNAYVTGRAFSSEQTFPVTVGPDLTQNGEKDAFVAKVSSQGRGLVYCGYIGGAGAETPLGIAVDAAGNAYVSGYTISSESTFPVKVGPDLTYNGGGWDGFVAKIVHTLLEAAGSPRPGGTVNFTLTATDAAGLAYVLGSSFGTGPINIGKRSIGLSVDKLLEFTVGNMLPTIFVGYQGVIGTNGQATAKINIPNAAALIGVRIHSAFVTISPPAPFGIRSISNTYSFQIMP